MQTKYGKAVKHENGINSKNMNLPEVKSIPPEPDQANLEINSTIMDKMAPKKMMKQQDVLVHE